jgi:FAD-dependent urate hydroxylase
MQSGRWVPSVSGDGIPVRRGTTVATLTEQNRGAHVVLDDGSAGDYDVVVGADGVRSWVRAATFGGTKPRSLGQASWRFIVDGGEQISTWTVLLGRRTTFLMVPLGHGRTYCYADGVTRTAFDPAAEDVTELARRYSDFAQPVPTMLQSLAATGEPPHFSPIEEVVQEPWVKGHVVLVGDAAHAMSPNMAEGVGMALEDALVLAEIVGSHRPLREYDSRRRSRVRFVRTQTHRRDRTRDLPRFVRNAALRWAGQRIFRSNYDALLTEP